MKLTLYERKAQTTHIIYEYQLNTYLTVDSVVKMTEIAHISVRDIQTIAFVQNYRNQ